MTTLRPASLGSRILAGDYTVPNRSVLLSSTFQLSCSSETLPGDGRLIAHMAVSIAVSTTKSVDTAIPLFTPRRFVESPGLHLRIQIRLNMIELSVKPGLKRATGTVSMALYYF